METLLVFLAIAAIQMLAAYTKQKKEAAKKAAQKYTPPPQATEPIPDPFREEEPEFEPLSEPGLPEGKKRPSTNSLPNVCYTYFSGLEDFQDIQSSSQPISLPEPLPEPELLPSKFQLSTKHNPQLNLKEGIIWAAILQEPRYRVKWKQK
jgi:hypothetical protein